MKARRFLLIIVFCVIPLWITPSQIITDEAGDLKAVRDVPKRRDFSESLMKQLKIPEGFSINVFAKDLKKPRMMAAGTDGTIYVTELKTGDVVALRDKNNDGVADEKVVVAKDLDNVHGITIHDNKMYLCAPEKLWVADIKAGGSISEPRILIDNLPEGGRHENRTIAFGPDGMLYISVGSSCNACEEKNPEHAAILRAKPDGSSRAIFCSGLRNTIGFGWHPVTKQMWGMDHGSDWRGNDAPPEELNRLEEGKNYGWPYCYGKAQPDPQMENPKNRSKTDYCAKTAPMTLGYQAHAAPIAMIFYTGNKFPAEYKNDAFAAMHGSWNRKPPVGYEVVRIHFEDGKPVKFEGFLKGFLTEGGKSRFGRPAGLCIARDGSLIISDDDNGVIYRVTYAAKGK